MNYQNTKYQNDVLIPLLKDFVEKVGIFKGRPKELHKVLKDRYLAKYSFLNMSLIAFGMAINKRRRVLQYNLNFEIKKNCGKKYYVISGKEKTNVKL